MLVASLVFLLLLFKESEGGFRSLFFSKKSADKEVCTDRMNWWDEDGAPPFVVTDAKEQARNREIIDAYNRLGPHVTHFCFLVHGHRGFRKDLSYLHTVMELLVDQKKLSLAERLSSNDQKKDMDGTLRHDMVVHNAVCNEHRTTDGVVNGGERLVTEMLETIRSSMKERRIACPESPLVDVTISIVGNSLGGIYGRYAIARLGDVCKDLVLDGKYRLHFNIFCTTASPHLGVSKHTYVRLPRSAEIGLARAMGNTGKDL